MLKIFIFILLPAVVFSQLYYWVDDKGVKHFSSTPPANQNNVNDYSEHDTTPIEQVEQEKQALQEKIAEQEKQRNAGKYPKIVMYSHTESNACKIASEFFKANHIPYTEYDIAKMPEKLEEFENAGGKVIPFILVGDKKMNGWNEQTMKILLGMN